MLHIFIVMFMYSFVSLIILIVKYVPFWVFSLIVLLCALSVYKCALYYCHRVSTQLQLTNVTYHTITCISEISLTKELHVVNVLKLLNFVIKVPDDGSDEPKDVTQCCMPLKYCV